MGVSAKRVSEIVKEIKIERNDKLKEMKKLKLEIEDLNYKIDMYSDSYLGKIEDK